MSSRLSPCQSLMALIAAMMVTFLAPPAVAAELVVVSSTISEIRVGKIVNSSNDFTLPEGSVITLISESGKAITLKGPRSGPIVVEAPDSASSSLVPAISNIFSGKKTETSSLGVMRSALAPKVPDDPWAIIAIKTGKYCVTKLKPVILWRPVNTKTSRLIMTNIESGKEVKTVWHTGQPTLHWPRLLPLVDKATYRVDLSGENRPARLTIILVPDLPSIAHAAAWMSKQGCLQQAIRLLKTLR